MHTSLLDRQSGELTWTSSISLAERVQYAVVAPSARFLYVSTSDGASRHVLYALAIDPASGVLTQQGEPLVPDAGRIIHLSIDASGRYLVLAHNQTSRLSMVRLGVDGQLGGFVAQEGSTDTGFFAHQALFDATGGAVIACGLGAAGSEKGAEREGTLTVFAQHAGSLTRTQQVALSPGLGARHLDYLGDRVYVLAERGNRLLVHGFSGGVLEPTPRFDVTTLIDPSNARPRQRAGAIHIHPSGEFVYVSNRAAETVSTVVDGASVEVFAGGENNIALFELEPGSGEPRRVAHYDTRGFEPRTFSIDAQGQFLFVGNQVARNARREDGSLAAVPSNVTVFRIGADGRLSYAAQRDFSRGEVFWLGTAALR